MSHLALPLQPLPYGSATPAQFINCCAFYEFTKCAAQFINCANSQIAPNKWSKWKRRFECFRNASGLVKEDEVQQVSALLYCMGEPADDVLTSTKISTEDRQKYASVVGKFDDYFKVRRNVILERARFNR